MNANSGVKPNISLRKRLVSYLAVSRTSCPSLGIGLSFKAGFILSGFTSVITSMSQSLNEKSLENVSGIARSMLIGSVCGAVLLPALFPAWVALHVDGDLVNCGNGFGSRKKDVDHFLVMVLFVIWMVAVSLGYTSSAIPGAIAASLCVGSIAGALLGALVDQRKFP